MPSSRAPALKTPALDFCQLVATKQQSDVGFAVPLVQADQARLDQVLQDAQRGATPELEERARRFLITYQETERNGLHVLTDRERRRLVRIVSNRQPRWRPTRRQTQWALALLLVVVVAAMTLGFMRYLGTLQSGPAPGTAPRYEQGQQIPPANSDLQNLKQDWGPWSQLTTSDERPQTGSPALLLLEEGAYYTSTKWTVAADSPAWQADLGNNIGTVNVKGNYADITDADGNPYIVGINQSFIVSGNPNTVLRVDPTGSVYSMTLAKATAIRQPIKN